MAQVDWFIHERRYTGATLLLTGAGSLILGWAASTFFTSGSSRPSKSQDAAEILPHAEPQHKTYSDQDMFSEAPESEPPTPRGVGSGRQPPRRTNTALSYNPTEHVKAEYKQAILIRTDVDMGTGKVAAQACHASVSAVKKAWRSKNPAYKAWEANNAIKVCLAVEGEQALMTIREQARDAGLPTAVVVDATERTVLAIGPGASKDIDAITQQLKLFDEM